MKHACIQSYTPLYLYIHIMICSIYFIRIFIYIYIHTYPSYSRMHGPRSHGAFGLPGPLKVWRKVLDRMVWMDYEWTVKAGNAVFFMGFLMGLT